MQSRRQGWEELCAFLAVVVGLSFATACWADTWPPGEGVNPYTDQTCPPETKHCNGAPQGCQDRGVSGMGDDWFKCDDGSGPYASFQVTADNPWGTCAKADKDKVCLNYAKWPCLKASVYKTKGCDEKQKQCGWIDWVANLCDPRGGGAGQ